MDGLLNYSFAFVLLLFALVVLLGKADWLMAKYKPVVKERRLVFVKYCQFDPKRARPLFAFALFVLAAFMVLEYLFRPLPLYSAVVLLAVLVPIALYVEFKCRRK